MDEVAQVPLVCPDCGAQMPATAAFCPGCGRAMQTEPMARAKVGILPENVAGALAYLTFVPAVVFLLVEPYKRNRFVRFHSIQCLLLWVVGLAGMALFKLLGLLLYFIPVAGPLLAIVATAVAGIAAALLWLVLVVKAIQGSIFEVPVLGDIARQHAISA